MKSLMIRTSHPILFER